MINHGGLFNSTYSMLENLNLLSKLWLAFSILNVVPSFMVMYNLHS